MLYLGVTEESSIHMSPDVKPDEDPNKTKAEELIGYAFNCCWGNLMSFKSPHHVYWSGCGPYFTRNQRGLHKIAWGPKGTKVSLLVDMDARRLAVRISDARAAPAEVPNEFMEAGVTLPAAVRPWLLTGEKDSVSISVKRASASATVVPPPVPPPSESDKARVNLKATIAANPYFAAVLDEQNRLVPDPTAAAAAAPAPA